MACCEGCAKDVADLVDEVVVMDNLLSDVEARVIKTPAITGLQTPLERCLQHGKTTGNSLENIALSLETLLRMKKPMS